MSIHNVYIEPLFHTNAHSAVYFLISLAVSTILQAIALFLQARRGRSHNGEALLLIGVPVAAVVALVVRGLFWRRQVVLTAVYVLYYGTKSVYVQRRASTRLDVDSVQSVACYSLATSVWCASLAAPCVSLNLAVDYGYHSGLFVHHEDAWLLGACVLLYGLVCWSYTAVYQYERLPIGEQQHFMCNCGPWRWSRNPVAACDMCFCWVVYCLCVLHVPAYIVYCVLFSTYGVLKDVQSVEVARHSKHYMSCSYRAWRQRTSPIAWVPPGFYMHVPWCIKRAFFFESASFETQQLPGV
jgi:steroid 5-alpha reductase family enzyme